MAPQPPTTRRPAGPRPEQPWRTLLSRLREVLETEAGALLTGVSVYREPADHNAVLFQLGLHDWAAARTPGTRGPTPPLRAPANLTELTAACVNAGLLSLSVSGTAAGEVPPVFMTRGIAVELHELLAAAGRRAEVADAHRRAAQYWQWHAAGWPQDRQADVGDLLAARRHLLEAGDLGQVVGLTAGICAQLRAWGDLDRESELVQATLEAMPSPSAGRARWLHELAAIAQARGEHAAAGDWYLQSVQMFAEVGEAGGAARGYESLGVLAQARGDYRKAERHYREATAAGYRAGPVAWAPSAPSVSGVAPDAGESPGVEGGADPPRRSHRAARPGRPSWPGQRIALVALPLALALTATIAMARLAGRTAPASSIAADTRRGVATAQRARAAAWVARQVSHSAVVACDPAMCAALRARGTTAGNLLVLGPGGQPDPLGSDIVVTTAAVRSEFGARLGGVYAPLVLASFGTGGARVDVRATAPDGAAAYRRALRADRRARRRAGTALLRNGQLTVTPAARRALAGGRVDARLLTTIAALAHLRHLRVIGFGDAGPGASPAAPLRSAELAAAAPGTLGPLTAFLRAQRPPYLAISISVTRPRPGQPVLRLAFGEPSPLGLLPATASPAGVSPAGVSPAGVSPAGVNTGPGPR